LSLTRNCTALDLVPAAAEDDETNALLTFEAIPVEEEVRGIGTAYS